MQSGYTSYQRFSLLVVENNVEWHAMINQALLACMPKAKIKFVTTVHETVHYLNQCVSDDFLSIQLLFLDLDIPTSKQGMQLLETIRTLFPHLPVAVFSADQSIDTVVQAYQLGANSFMRKPMNPDQWLEDFNALADYWLRTVILPSTQ